MSKKNAIKIRDTNERKNKWLHYFVKALFPKFLVFLFTLSLLISQFTYFFVPKAYAASFNWTASVVIGQPDFISDTANNGGISAHSLKGPTGVSSDGGNRLFISDAGNKRLLIYNPVPTSSNSDASLVLGQDNFTTVTTRTLGPTSYPNPYSISSDGTKLYLADRNNQRVLIWNTIPSTNDVAPNIVLGQPDFTTNTLYDPPSASTMGIAFSIFSDGTRLFAGNSGAKRISIFNIVPSENNVNADVVIGQPDFVTKAIQPNSCVALGSGGGPADVYSIFSDGTRLFIADFFANRVLIWNTIPTTNGVAADVVLGQPDCASKTANNGGLSAHSLSGPTSVWSDGVRLFVTDWSNNRVLVWNSIPTSNNVSADSVIGQPDLISGTANNGGISANSIKNPFIVSGVASSNGTKLFVVDYSNNRVLTYYYPANFDLTSPSNNTTVYTNSPTFTWQASADSNGTLSKYQLYIDGALNTDNITSMATSTQPTVVLSNGAHTWQIKAINTAGNFIWSTSTFNIAIDTAWVKSGSNPVLEPGSAGSWDESMVIDSSVLKESDGTYKMWYLGGNTANVHGIGYATSSDGITWTKYSENPVMLAGTTGAWDEYLWEARVIHDGDTYKMWYQGATAYNANFKTGYATSSDGITWTKYSGNPVLSGDSGTWDETYVGARNIIKVGNTYKLFYEGDSSSNNFAVGLATSSDGVNWTKSSSNPVLQGESGKWDNANIIPNVILVDDTYYMFYSINHGPPSEFGLATSTDGISWTKNASNPIVNLQGASGAWDNAWSDLISVVQENTLSTKFLGYYRSQNPNNASKWTIGLISNQVPSSFGLSSPSNNSWSATKSPTLSWNASSASSAESGLSKYQLYVDSSLNRDSISSGSTSTTPSSDLSDGDHTWYVVAVDGLGYTTQSTSTRTVRIDSTNSFATSGCTGGSTQATASGQATISVSAGGTAIATTVYGTQAKAEVSANAVVATTTVSITPTVTTETTVSSAVSAVPSTQGVIGGYVYNYSATSGGATVSTFNQNVTITMTYTDSQVSGFSESSLVISYWDASANQWKPLSTTVNTVTNTLTAVTNHFTYFAILGEKVTTTTTTTTPVSQMTRDQLLAEVARIQAIINQLMAQLAAMTGTSAITGVPSTFSFTKTLQFGATGDDVKYLQLILNSSADTRIASTGVGSSGHETTYFGALTKAAAVKFQEKYASQVLTPLGLSSGTGLVGSATRAKLNALLGK